MRLEQIYGVDLGRSRGFPLFLSAVAAGFPSPADDFLDGQIDLNQYLVQNAPATFFVRVSGESMTGAGIFPGDLLVVDRSKEAQDGDVVIAAVEGELLVKRLQVRSGGVFLLSENDGYAPLEVASPRDLVVWGVVQYVLHKP